MKTVIVYINVVTTSDTEVIVAVVAVLTVLIEVDGVAVTVVVYVCPGRTD